MGKCYCAVSALLSPYCVVVVVSPYCRCVVVVFVVILLIFYYYKCDSCYSQCSACVIAMTEIRTHYV